MNKNNLLAWLAGLVSALFFVFGFSKGYKESESHINWNNED